MIRSYPVQRMHVHAPYSDQLYIFSLYGKQMSSPFGHLCPPIYSSLFFMAPSTYILPIHTPSTCPLIGPTPYNIFCQLPMQSPWSLADRKWCSATWESIPWRV